MTLDAAGDLVLVDDSDTVMVTYTPNDAWETGGGRTYSRYHDDSYHVTTLAGARITFTFSGTYVAYYSDLNHDHNTFLAAIDGGPPTNASSYSASWSDGPRLLFYAELSAGRHTLSITNVREGASMGLDYFAYRPLDGNADLATSTTSSGPNVGQPSTALHPNLTHNPIRSPTNTPINAPTTPTPDASAALQRPALSQHHRVSAWVAAVIALACCVTAGCVAAFVAFLRLRKRRLRCPEEEAPPPYLEGTERTRAGAQPATSNNSDSTIVPFIGSGMPSLADTRPQNVKRVSLNI